MAPVRAEPGAAVRAAVGAPIFCANHAGVASDANNAVAGAQDTKRSTLFSSIRLRRERDSSGPGRSISGRGRGATFKGSVAKFDFSRKIEFLVSIDSMTYRIPHSSKTNFIKNKLCDRTLYKALFRVSTLR